MLYLRSGTAFVQVTHYTLVLGFAHSTKDAACHFRQVPGNDCLCTNVYSTHVTARPAGMSSAAHGLLFGVFIYCLQYLNSSSALSNYNHYFHSLLQCGILFPDSHLILDEISTSISGILNHGDVRDCHFSMVALSNLNFDRDDIHLIHKEYYVMSHSCTNNYCTTARNVFSKLTSMIKHLPGTERPAATAHRSAALERVSEGRRIS